MKPIYRCFGQYEVKINVRHLILFNTLLLLGIIHSICSGQDFDPFALKASEDTVFLGDYIAVRYNYVDSLGRRTSITNELVFYKGSKEVLAITEGASSIDNLCSYDPQSSESCFLRDINADGFDEVLVAYFTGGANCCFGANLYSIDGSLKLIFRIEPNLREFELIDLENDQIPEFIFVDETFAHWKDTYKVYLPRLIWRWDGEKYRLANFKFSDHILQDFDLTNLKSEYFWSKIITLYYAGKFELADSLFNAWGSPIFSDKGTEYKLFKEQFEYGEYWQELLESDW